MNSSTIPCPSKNEAKSSLTRREIRDTGKLRRRFLRKGTAIARSPKFQYSITRMLAGCTFQLSARGAGSICKSNRRTASNTRTRHHLRGVIRKKLARAAASAATASFELASDRCIDLSTSHLRRSFQGPFIQQRQRGCRVPKANGSRTRIYLLSDETKEKACDEKRYSHKAQTIFPRPQEANGVHREDETKSNQQRKAQQTAPQKDLKKHGVSGSKSRIVFGTVDSRSRVI